MAGENECWVTTALDEEQCVNALMLAKFLQRVITSRKLVVLVAPFVPEKLRNILQGQFDVCITLDEDQFAASGTKLERYAKLYCWSLIKWKKFVFLEPHCLVVKNCDELFKFNGFASVAANNDDDGALFVSKPSLKVWQRLLKLSSYEKLDFDKALNIWEEKLVLDKKFNIKVNLQHGLLATNLSDIQIVNFTGIQPLEIMYRNAKQLITGYYENALMDLWEYDWKHGVLPLLKTLTKINITSIGLGEYLEQETLTQTKLSASNNTSDNLASAIAVIGMSCRFPEANNLDEYWKVLIEGQDCIGPVPAGYWKTGRTGPVPEEAERYKGGFLNFPVDEFDAKFFGMSPAEVALLDPQQRLTLKVTWEALEDAGIDPSSIKDTFTGVFGGSWRLDYQDMLSQAGIFDEDYLRPCLGTSFGVSTAKISHFLGLIGPSICTESACSSSMVAVDLACHSLLKGESNLCLAYGVNLILYPFEKKLFESILSADFHCKTFDASADGYARAEGCGVLVLKRYADAVKDGDRVWGLIRGSAMVQEGKSSNIGTPTKECEAIALKLALERAHVEPKDVSFVETHGTGTPMGDPLEVAAVAEAYSRGREQPLIIGSGKTNIGHTESCSGIAGIMKVILSMKNEMIPPNINLKNLNPRINLESIPATIPLKPVEWKRDPYGKPRIAGVSCYGYTGTDTHIILQETPEVFPEGLFLNTCFSTRPCHILTLSAKSTEALDDNVKNYKSYLERTENSLLDIAYTSNTGRAKFPYRAAFIGSTKSEILNSMKTAVVSNQTPDYAPKICFLFTGQGSQYPGMAQSLYETNPIFKIHFDICDRTLYKNYGISIKDTLWGENSANISRTIYSQTSIFCVEYCLLKLWGSWGITPDYVLGHSLGEFAAAVAAGILTFENALKLVAERSRLIDGLPGGKMLVVKESFKTVDRLLKEFFKGSDNWLDYAAVNSTEQTVLAGSEINIRVFSEFCQNNGIKTHVLEATHAFHSRHMDPILEEYRQIASTVTYSVPSCVYVSGMEGRIVENNHVNGDYWVRHTRESVQFRNGSQAILNLDVNLFLEIGPQPVLSAMIMTNAEEMKGIKQVRCLPSIRKQEENWSTVLNTLGKLYLNGFTINWKQFDQFTNAKKVTAPFYPFQMKKYWYEMPDKGPSPIHPLVGTPMSNASGMKLYTNKLELEKSTEFLKDHLIGSKIIFPGAGYLEMCLVSGHAATQCTESSYFHPTSAMTVESLVFETPLGITENETTEMQVIVSSEDSGETRVTIYSKLVLDKDTQKWIKHASGVFSPYAVQTKEDQVILNDDLDSIRDRCGKEIQMQTKDIYGQFANFGLKLGPTFHCLKSMWKGNKELFFEVDVPQYAEKYACHPAIIDSLFQAIMLAVNAGVNKLHVPVAVSKFIWFARIETPVCFIHSKFDSNDAVAVLYDSNGKLLAQMVGPTLMETSVSKIMSSVESQRMALPTMYEDVWRSQLGVMEKRANLSELFPSGLFGDEYSSKIISKYNTMNEEDRHFTVKSNKLYGLYMIKSLHDLGWDPELGEEYDFKEIVTSLNIVRSFEGFFKYMIIELSQDGYFELANLESDRMKLRAIRTLPAKHQINNDIKDLHQKLLSMSKSEIELVSAAGQMLSVILTGKKSLQILFPAGSNEITAQLSDATICKYSDQLLNDQYAAIFEECKKTLEISKDILRILEVGAGNGNQTKIILPYLNEFPSGYEYTFTDISSNFVENGQKIFENSNVRVVFKTLNIEEDVLNQGFIPNYYDIIIADNVIHATKNISQTLRNLRNLLREDGLMWVCERTKPARNKKLTSGLLDNHWKFTDYELRPHNCEITLPQWELLLKQNDFNNVRAFPYADNLGAVIIGQANSYHKYTPLPEESISKSTRAWIVFSEENEISQYYIQQLSEIGNQVVVVTQSPSTFKKLDKFSYSLRGSEESDMLQLFEGMSKDSNLKIEGVIFLWGVNYNNSDFEGLCKPFFSLLKCLIHLDHPKLFVITTGVVQIGDYEVSPPVSSILWGMTKTFQNEKPDSMCRCIDFDIFENGKPTIDQLKETFSELFINDGEICVAYRVKQRNVCRMSQRKVLNSALAFPKSERFRLVLPPTKAINDLRFGPLEKMPVEGSNIEVCIKAYSLNFRDVFAILKPSVEFEKMNTVGVDYSGVVTAVGPNVKNYKVGDAVTGCNLLGDSLPSYIVDSELKVMKIPPGMTFSEAATLPIVAATAYMSLFCLTKLTEKDTILIHTASGGVGIVAIQLAKSVGATIVATVGSKRKRRYLRNLGIKYIFHSRNTNFEKDIRKALNGRGVDIVLNSLTSEGFKEASLNICNQGARFIEMSKLNTWTAEKVNALRPDVQYDIVDISSCTNEEMGEVMVNVEELLNQSIIQPLPYVRFDVSEFREALTYMQKAKHIGKIVCVMPDKEMKSISSDPFIPMFNNRSTYLITGGLGGIGFEVAKWMANSGAKHIVLVGRSSPKETVAAEMERINSTGKELIALNYDVGDLEQCKSLLHALKSKELNLPPLRGIMHAAGVLSDAIFVNQTWEKYLTAFNPKVNGGWNLHQCTLNHPLEHFVMFSSATANVGSIGQSNYVSANLFLDSLAGYRNSIGLPATTINWGQWSQVGMAANMEIVGIKPFTVLQGISALEKLLRSPHVATMVCEIDFGTFKQLFTTTKKYFQELSNTKDETFVVNDEKFWTNYETSDDYGKINVIKSMVRSVVRQILKMDNAEPLSDNEDFQKFGMDSLMTIEIKNALQFILGDRARITTAALKESHNVEQLTSQLHGIISGKSSKLSREDLIKLLREDSQLPDYIQPACKTHCLPSKIKSILFTGATGMLGPYIIMDIFLKYKNVEKVYCLVRGSKTLTGKQRLEEILKEKGLLDKIPMDKIECVNGSVTDQKLGLTEERYFQLSEEIDAVFHLAVKSDLIDGYKKFEESDVNNMRAINVVGTLRVLEFACSKKTKVLFHASSVVANGKVDEDGCLSEDWPSFDDFDKMIDLGYILSKFICDLLVAQAVERGLPAKVFRFPIITGDSLTGANANYDNNQMTLRLMSYIHLGLMADMWLPFNVLPVDVCSNLSLQIFFNDHAPYEVYNIYNPNPKSELEFIPIAKEMGYDVEPLEWFEFAKKIEGKKDSALLHFLKEYCEKDNTPSMERYFQHPLGFINAFTQNPEQGFCSKKLSKLIPGYPEDIEGNLSIIKRELVHAKEIGIFEEYGV